MSKPKVVEMGTEVWGVHIKGDPAHPERERFRVTFPFGDVDIVRATDGADADYWIHVRVNHERSASHNPDERTGEIKDARVDHVDKHASDTGSIAVPLRDPSLDHIAIRIGRSERTTKETR